MLEIGLLDLNQELACMLKFARVCESGERREWNSTADKDGGAINYYEHKEKLESKVLIWSCWFIYPQDACLGKWKMKHPENPEPQ